MTAADFISVDYRLVGGVHVFTSDQVPGLYVASADPREAFDQVSECITALYKHAKGVDISVEPAMSVERFLEFIGAADGRDALDVPHPAVFAARGFAFRQRRAA